MIPLYTEKEFNETKYTDKLKLKCYQCDDCFLKVKSDIVKCLKNHPSIKCKFCSKKCHYSYRKQTCNTILKCNNCNAKIIRQNKEVKKVKRSFCSHSCSAQYYNKNRKFGYQRSKLEEWIEDQLLELYPDLQFDFNKKTKINSELDIYIPSLKLAFELNGIFHYEPIFGKDKLDKIQNNDNRKFQACAENEISLCIIDTSSQKRFTEKSSQKFLSIIVEIIEKKAHA